MKPLTIFLAVALAGCAGDPPIISADTYCVRTSHIDVTTFQVDAMKKDPGTWRPLAVQIADANGIRAKNC